VQDEPESCCFDDWADYFSKRARKRGTASGVTRALLEELRAAGLRDRTLLDVGCGVGDLALAAVADGAARATGMDLSRESIREAEQLAVERGAADRVSFSVGDGATDRVEPHDVVVLNRVFCCYPDVDGLLGNSLSAARSVYAFTTPPSSGLGGIIARLQTTLANAWYALRRKKFGGFRVFVHDVAAIDARVREAGFRPRAAGRRRLVWHLAVYARD
jgi:magnesium-protoporphyrin O-methyltransferase